MSMQQSELQAKASELIEVCAEIKKLNANLRELRKRKNELEGEILTNLEEAKIPGFKYNNITFLNDEKTKSMRKKKGEVERDLMEVLDKYEVKGNRHDIIEDIEKARKGPKTSISALKIKSAIFD